MRIWECPLLWSKIKFGGNTMKSTALGAETKKEEKIIFISDAHEKFYYEKLQEVRYQDVYHKALCYCLGISDDTRRNINSIYDFKTGCVKTECLHEGWQTSGSLRVMRMAFNLYCNGTPSVLTMRIWRSRLTSAGSTRWRKYSAVLMHHILAGDTDPLSGVCDL